MDELEMKITLLQQYPQQMGNLLQAILYQSGARGIYTKLAAGGKY
jgi:hypothetical protein